MIVKAVEPNRHVVLGPHPTTDFESTWALALYPDENGATRLISRCRCRLPRGLRGLMAFLILDPGQFVMERKMLLEIRERAESSPSAAWIESIEAPRAETRKAVWAGGPTLPRSLDYRGQLYIIHYGADAAPRTTAPRRPSRDAHHRRRLPAFSSARRSAARESSSTLPR
jgi:hypothetical protein